MKSVFDALAEGLLEILGLSERPPALSADARIPQDGVERPLDPRDLDQCASQPEVPWCVAAKARGGV